MLKRGRNQERLKCIASNVKSGGIVADIGCDHAFTSIYLVEEKLARGAIAIDINKEPLKRAWQHIQESGMEEYISVRLSNGARGLKKGEADTILISGMGGALIASILEESINIIKDAKELVLSPQSEIYIVRHFLHDNGFKIVSEEMVKEQGKFYVVIRAVPGSQHYKDESGYIYGEYLIENKNKILEEFLLKEQKRTGSILDSLASSSGSAAVKERKDTLLKEYNMIKGILKKINLHL
ncbi:MAG: SAM-dependent methyltransferase [Lachnospiraceae bacterium]|nr:SAM-dependent methyltransferase [Lachnospiraceae bacterium]